MEATMNNFTGASSMVAAVSTILLLHTIAIPTGGILAESATPKCGVRNKTNWWQLSSGLELMFGDIQQDYTRARDLCKSHNAILPYEGVVDSIKPCLKQRESDDYYWLQTCSNSLKGRVFSVTKTRKVFEEEYHNYVCVITTAIKINLTIQVEDQSNTTYHNKGTKNIFQAWTGQTLNLFCETGLPNMLPRLLVKNGTNDLVSNDSSIMTWTPENCQDDISVTCESRHCSEDVLAAVQTDVRIKVQCPLEIVSFTSNSREDTEGLYKKGENATLICATKGSSDVTIMKTQGMEMKGIFVSRNHTYSITSLGCDDMGTYYCIARQGDTQVNRSINIAVNGSCPPRLCQKETQRKGSPDIKTVGQTVTVCVMAFPVLSNSVSFNGQNVLCDGGISSPGWQCSIKKSEHFMTFNFAFMIHNVSLLDDKKITIGLKTSEGGEMLNLTYSLNKDGQPYLITTPPNDIYEAASLSLPFIIGIVFIVSIPLIAGFMVGVFYWKMRGKHSFRLLLSLLSNHNGHSNRGSESTDDEDLYSTANVGSHLGLPNPITGRGDSQESRELQNVVERENQNLIETNCTSSVEVYANLPTTNGTLKDNGRYGYHPMRSGSSNPTTGRYISQEGLLYVTVDHSQSSASKGSALDKQRGFRERDSIQYASIDFEKTRKYKARKDKEEVKRLKHRQCN